MEKLERGRVISALENGWGSYVQRFQMLPEPARTDFLNRQGYARLADLLAHVIAWWELAREKFVQKQTGASAAPVAIDVDEFNAQAVARVSEMEVGEMIALFQAKRLAMLNLVEQMPDEIFDLPDVQQRLWVEVIEHLEEHDLP